MQNRPLEGVRILAVEHFLAGPLGSMLLADWGAEVIRIERPGGGDAWRSVNTTRKDGQPIPLAFITRNRNKKSLTLDLKSPRGKQIFLDLVKTADVVWENMAPDAMDNLGLGYESLRAANPRIVYTSISGFGHDDAKQGPYSARPAFDFVTQAMSGLMWLPTFGAEPAWLGFTLTDLAPGLMATTGTLLALRQRDRTDEAQRVDLAMYDVAALLNEKNLAVQAAVGRTPRSLYDLQNTNQLGLFRACDGYVAVGVVSNAVWPQFCSLIGHPDLALREDLSTLQQRTENLEVLIAAVNPWAFKQPRAKLVDALLAAGIPSGPVQTHDEVLNCPQLHARGMFVEVQTEHGPVKSVGNPIKLGSIPMESRPPPQIGQHTDDLLSRLLGISPEDLDGLRRDKVI